MSGRLLQHRIEVLTLGLSQSDIDRPVDLLMDRLAQVADRSVQVAERGKLDPLLDSEPRPTR